MSAPGRLDLYALLPAIFRARDMEQPGQPLRAVYDALQHGYDLIDQDIRALYDDWFIETCAPDIVPRIGLAVDAMLGEEPPLWSARAAVAHTMSWGRHVGSLYAIAQAAACATGWPCVARDLAADLARSACAGLSITAATARVPRNGTLDAAAARVAARPARTCAVLHAGAPEPYVPGKIGLDFWTLPTFPVEGVMPGGDGASRTFDPAGVHLPLYFAPDVFAPSDPRAVMRAIPGALDGEGLAGLLSRHEVPPFAIRVRIDGEWHPVDPRRLRAADLRDPPAPDGDTILVDPERGTFLCGFAAAEDIRVDYTYACGGEVGAGPFFAGFDLPGADRVRLDDAADLAAAASPSHRDRVIELSGSETHQAPPEGICIASGATLAIVAAPGERPMVAGRLRVRGDGPGGALVLAGLLVPDGIAIDGVQTVTLGNCTVAPGRDRAAVVDGAALPMRLRVQACILGGTHVTGGDLHALGSIIDAGGGVALSHRGHGESVLHRSTVRGDIHCRLPPDIHECLIDGVVAAADSRRRHRFDVESRRFGDPGYMRPIDDADQASGAFADEGRSGRLDRLRAVLARMVPDGLTCALRLVN